MMHQYAGAFVQPEPLPFSSDSYIECQVALDMGYDLELEGKRDSYIWVNIDHCVDGRVACFDPVTGEKFMAGKTYLSLMGYQVI